MTEMKGIRIVSDGTVMGTKVYDADGKDVTASLHIRSIRWSHKAGGIPTAELSCLLSEIEAHVPAAQYDKRWVAAETLADECVNYLPIEEIPKTRESREAYEASGERAATEKGVSN